MGALVGACGGDDRGTVADTLSGETALETVASEVLDETDDAEDEVEEPQPSLCDPARRPLVTPIATDDVDYGGRNREDCYTEACQCDAAQAERLEAFLACEPMGFGWFEPFGSTYFLMEGREDGDCVFNVGRDLEGSAAIYRGAVPLPMVPWPGLAGVLDETLLSDPLEGIAEHCEHLGSCSLLFGMEGQCDAMVDPICPPSRVDACE